MTLSKQLYIIIFSIFFLIFTGNFIISVNNFKNYIEIESTTKSQDTATALGMSLKLLIKDKSDPEIRATIRAIFNSGFYKEIRLENSEFLFTKEQVMSQNNIDNSYEIKKITIDKDDGEIINNDEDINLESELLDLDNEIKNNQKAKSDLFSFVPSKTFKKNSLNLVVVVEKDGVEKKINGTLIVDNVLVKIVREEKFDSVPQFFIDMIDIGMKEVSTQISNGWKNDAVLYVSGNAGEAYLKLYEQAKITVYYSLISFVIAYLLLVIFLRFILRPLKNIEELALKIYKGKFQTIEKLPFTTELKNVSIAMNNMSVQIENMITNLNKNLEKITEKLSQDELTGLQIEQTFISDMEHILNKKQKGYLFSVQIDDLSTFSKQNSTQLVNSFIKEFAVILDNCHENATAYRIYGSSFSIIIINVSKEDISNIIQLLKEKFTTLAEKYKKINIGHAGCIEFDSHSDTETLISLSNDAFQLAKQIGINEIFVNKNNMQVRDKDEWKKIIYDVIDNEKFDLNYVNETARTDNKNILMKESFISIVDENNNEIPTGTLISISQDYGKVIELDKKVIHKVLEEIKVENIKYEVVVNISFDSVVDINFNKWMYELLSQNKKFSNKLLFTITAYAASRDTEGYLRFINLVHKLGAKVMVKRFEIKFISLDHLKKLNLDYIRLSRDYTSSISTNFTQQTFAESIYEVSKLINVKILAENVGNDKDFEFLKTVGIYGASR